MTKLLVRTGVEGPRHDPYSYTEYTVKRPSGDVAVLHDGLGFWVKINGVKANGDETEILSAFHAASGFADVHALRRAYQHVLDEPRRRHRASCDCREIKICAGMPGETFVLCAKCDAVLEYDFDRCAIE